MSLARLGRAAENARCCCLRRGPRRFVTERRNIFCLNAKDGSERGGVENDVGRARQGNSV